MDAEFPGIVGRASRLVWSNRFRPDPATLRGTVWITFQHRALRSFEDRPGSFFELRPDGYRMGMGFYHASPRTMDRVRGAIDRDPREFPRIVAPCQGLDVCGDRYVRSRASHLTQDLATWYDRQSVYVEVSHVVDDVLFGDALVGSVLDIWLKTTGLYAFFRQAQGPSDR